MASAVGLKNRLIFLSPHDGGDRQWRYLRRPEGDVCARVAHEESRCNARDNVCINMYMYIGEQHS
jgi:hypothetical protein